MKTEKLYETDGMLHTFRANIIETKQTEKGFALMLDRTAFFPEGGGQTADKGMIGNAKVLDVQIVDGEIWHDTDILPETETVDCTLDFDERFRKMQNHLGEHLLCGAIHKLYGYENVGFHLGADYMTFDISGPMTAEQIYEAEKLANRAVAEDAPVRCYVPEDISALEYRAKSEKLEAVAEIRIVEVKGFDRCACCAPHLDRAGKVGLIKIVDAMKYKGGMRFSALCGFDALADYDRRLTEIRRVSALLSAKPHEIALGVEAKLAELGEAKKQIGALKRELSALKLAVIEETDGNICIFDDTMDGNALREFATNGVKKTSAIFAVFSGNDETGYQFVIASATIPLKAKVQDIRAALGGKCGGSDKMLFGHADASKDAILTYFG
ncbi:MAG: alanyl-tRNA editing protein [Clostridia bacterium]|nr:alanyl-tRNA editing protein [Clostridia bacterium]